MVKLYGESSGYLLFTNGSNAVIVDTETGMIDDAGLFSDMLVLHPWRESNKAHDAALFDLAQGAMSDVSLQTITAAGRLYTIPKGAQEEAARALKWRKEHKRGGTPVGVNTARILANGGQIGINKVRHIAKYFPRHAVDKKGKGYKPGQDGFPSAGRIAWALWGGDTAWKWASAIVERENKALSAAGFSVTELPTISGTNAFEMARAHDGLSNSPDFVARVRLDGTGIDRLYMVNQEGQVFVWDNGAWDDLGHVNSDIATYDKSLDDPYDTVQKHHILIDPDSAIAISAHMQVDPFCSVAVGDLDPYEASLVAAAADEIDWPVVDSAIVAAGEEPLSGKGKDGYTPEERAANAKRQVRDKTGRFSKVGAKVMVGGDPSKSGSVTGIDRNTGNVSVQMDSGETVNVPASSTEPFDPSAAPVAKIQQDPNTLPTTPLDTSGILGEPRAPINNPKAKLPGGLPALDPGDLRKIVSNYPAWVETQRKNSDASKNRPVAPPPHAAGDYAPRHKKSDYIKDIEKTTGKTLYDSAYDHPMLADFFKNPMSSIWYSPITSSAEQEKTSVDKNDEGLGTPLTPETSDVEPMHFAVVSPDDPAAVMDLVALVPAASNSNMPSTFKRINGEWEKDDQILADLTSATPPPVVVLNSDVFEDVLAQVDSATTASAYVVSELDQAFIELYLSAIKPIVAVGVEGGLDRNRGNAEKLRRYWLYGRGAAKIRWNTPGDWTRCYRHLRKYMGPRAKGYCALRHKEATGVWTGSKFNIGKRNIRASAFDAFDVSTENQILEFAAARAAINSAKQKVILAGGGMVDESPGAQFVIPLVIPEGVETGDGRVFKKNALNMRNLPLPLLWQIKTGEGHDGSVVVGRIDRMSRTADGIGNAYGVFDSGPYGREAERMVRHGFLRGVSADLDKFEASEDDEDDDAKQASEAGDDTAAKKTKKKKKIGSSKISVDKARVMAVTIVPKPAFEQCKIFITDDPGYSVLENGETPMIPDGVYVDSIDEADASALVACGMIADAIPVVPPHTWFENPNLSGPTPLTVDDSGRVFGHIAAWHVDHIGMSMGTKPPRSKSNYAYFHTGVVRAANGKDYPVGQLTLSGGHASLEASAVDAARHYDDTGSAIADVRAGEDAYGIWVAGSVRPGATPEQVRALRASAPSGDWRPIRGSLELVAVCQVNVPGFPIARARVASGQVYALVAAGAATLAKMKSDPMAELSKRLEKIEERVGLTVLDQLKEIKSAEAATETLDNRVSELTARVRGNVAYNELGYISESTRKKLASEGKALPDGSYPIRNVAELKDAIQAYGRSKPSKRAAVRRHIMKRARGLDRSDLIPENWKSAGLVDDGVTDSLQARVAAARSAIEATETADTTDHDAVTASAVEALKARVAAARAELAEEEIWETDSPKGESTKLTPAQKAAAKRAAKKAGRPYPNMVDNINAAKKAKKSASMSAEETDTPKA